MHYTQEPKRKKKRETFAIQEKVVEVIQKSPYTTIEVVARKYDESNGVSLVEIMKRRTGGNRIKTLAIPQPVALAIAEAIAHAVETLETM